MRGPPTTPTTAAMTARHQIPHLRGTMTSSVCHGGYNGRHRVTVPRVLSTARHQIIPPHIEPKSRPPNVPGVSGASVRSTSSCVISPMTRGSYTDD